MQLASDFFGHRVARLSVIEEARSLLTMMLGSRGLAEVSGLYTYLVYGVPVIFVGLVVWLFRTQDRNSTFFAVFSLFGLALLVQQFRFHYYGSFALYLPLLVGIQYLGIRFERRRLAISVASILLLASAFYLPIHDRLFPKLTAGLDSHYRVVAGLMPDLQELCEERPGVVMAWNDVGHYVRYHTECSVIANNFLLTPLHSAKVGEIDHLASLTVDQLLNERPDISYIIANYPTLVLFEQDGKARLLDEDELTMANYDKPLFIGLISEKSPATAFPRLEFIRQIVLRIEGRQAVVARLFAVRDSGSSSSTATVLRRPDHAAVRIPAVTSVDSPDDLLKASQAAD
jgi:hypothetical protein